MRRGLRLALTVALVICLCGCSLFSATYVSSRPHELDEGADYSNQRHASSYPEIYSALTALITNRISDGVIILSDISEQVGRSYLEAAIRSVMAQEPMAIYCVFDIRFDLGSNAGRLAAAIHVDYSKTPEELASVKSVQTMQEVQRYLGQALEEFSSACVIRVEKFEQIDFQEFVSEYADDHPSTVLEIPDLKVSFFPSTGFQRVIEINFVYEHSQKDLVKMKTKVEPVFTAAELYVQGDTAVKTKFQQLHAFLMERNDYVIGSTDTLAYSLLQEGTGDSRAFACVYADMCRRAGLECRAIKGAKDGEEWYWNRLVINNRVFYIDLMDAERSGNLVFRTASEMGDYSWDKNA